MLRIGIIELENHSEVVRSFVEALHQVGVGTTLFISEQVSIDLKESIQQQNCDFYIMSNKESYTQFLKNHDASLRECDVLLCTSDSTNQGDVISYIWPRKAFLLIHDLNSTFDPFSYFYPSTAFPLVFKDYLKLMKFIFLRKDEEKRKARSTFDAYLTTGEALYNYALNQKWFDSKLVGYIPMSLHNSCSLPKEGEEISITIPGSVSLDRRDYTTVIESLNLYSLQKKIVVNLLGSSKTKIGKEIIQSFSDLKSDYLKVNVFHSYIDQTTFDQVMSDSDFLILPLNQYLKFGVFKEVNGLTCISGNINDMTRWGIPALIPHYYALESNLKNMCEQYSNATDLNIKLEDWVVQKKFNVYKIKSSKALIDYDAMKVGTWIKRMLLNV